MANPIPGSQWVQQWVKEHPVGSFHNTPGRAHFVDEEGSPVDAEAVREAFARFDAPDPERGEL